jgi:hypothetical protein
MALLETAADHREQLLRQIYEVNRATVEAGAKGDPAAIIIPVAKQHDSREAMHLVERLQMAGVAVSRAEADFEADGKPYPAGTFVIPMNQVFARYAKDLLEKQTYPEVRRSPNAAPEPPYDVTAWSLGMQMGVETVFVKKPLADAAKLKKLDAPPKPSGEVRGEGGKFSFDYSGADSATAVNRLLRAECRRASFFCLLMKSPECRERARRAKCFKRCPAILVWSFRPLLRRTANRARTLAHPTSYCRFQPCACVRPHCALSTVDLEHGRRLDPVGLSNTSFHTSLHNADMKAGASSEV